jgi:ABC-2 type transport system ATP-binding protein
MVENSPAAGVSDAKPVIECRKLTKVFKDFWMRDRARAVETLSFDVHPHEVFGLLGPNGSGKSTTIKILLGLLKPTSGRVLVFGHIPTDVGIKRRIGYLPEESYLYQFLNARETLEYYGKLFQLDHRTRTRRIDELLDMVGLTHAQFRPVREYSKGMQRRIGLAQALINDPDLLILDEPTTGLDPIGTRQVKDLIIEMGRRGKTVLLSSHLLADVEDVVDRMAILYGGRKRDEGTCDSLLTRSNQTLIETDELDDQTISEIDALIQRRTGGVASIHSVTKPRQKLEELFLGIVAKAQAERMSTSGAMQGGETAEFLRADEEEGQALIEQLMKEEEPIAPTVEELLADAEHVHSDPKPSVDPQQEVIESLMSDETSEPDLEPSVPKVPVRGHERSEAPEPSPRPDDVDRGVIDSLLDTGDEEEPKG